MKEIIDMFEQLNKNNIHYAVLRGYQPIESLFKSKDIDLFISPSDIKKASSLFTSSGFKKPKTNACNYPHIQFFKLCPTKLIKFDIVTDLCFGEKLIIYDGAKKLLDNTQNEDFIKILPPSIALLILCLHVYLDKREINDENLKRINELCLYCSKKDISSLPTFVGRLVNLCTHGTVELINQYMTDDIICEVEKSDCLVKYNNWKLMKLYTIIRYIKRYRMHQVHKKSIAIIGVDGSGKSTTINKLSEVLGDGCRVQYMGFREMETHFGKKWYESEKPIKFKLLPYIGIYLEMWHRYLKYRFDKWRIILFDRFPWEAFDNSHGKCKPIYFILFKVLFPNPKKVYYLYCSAETSLKRKDDIKDENLFINMKNRFDKKYLSNKHIISFNTDKLTIDEIVGAICQDIMDSNFYEYLF